MAAASFPSAPGGGADLAYDPSGVLHVAYYDASSGAPTYASRPVGAEAWSAPTTVDASAASAPAANPGRQVSLAVAPDGRVAVAYHAAAAADLKFATLEAGQWQVRTVDAKGVTGEYPSLAFDAQGVPFISYYRRQSGDLRLATPARAGRWKLSALAKKGDVGRFNDLAISPATGRAAVAFVAADGKTQFRMRQRAKFSKPITVEALAPAAAGELSLAFSPDGRPALAYYDASSGALKLAVAADAAARVFSPVQVAQAPAGADPHARLLLNPAGGAPQVVYHDASLGGVFLAEADPADPAGPFRLTRLADSTGGVGGLAAAINPQGTSVAYAVVNLDGQGGILVMDSAELTTPPPGANRPPTVRNQSASVPAGTTTSLRLDAADPDGDPLSFEITATGAGGTFGSVSPDARMAFTPSAGFTGTTWFTYTVTDGKSGPVLASVTVQVYSPQPMVITIPAGQSYSLSADLTGFTSLTIRGEGPTSVLNGNGFQVFSDNLLGGVTISDLTVRNLGRPWVVGGSLAQSVDNHAVYLVARGGSSVSIEDVTFDASSSVYLYTDADASAAIRRNTVLPNSLAPGGVRPDVSAPFFTASGRSSTARKAFEGNRVYESYVSFEQAKNWLVAGNVIDGDRGGINVMLCDAVELTGNYVHSRHDFAATDPDNPYGSQVSALSFYQSTNVRTHHNVLRDGEWMVRGLSGEFDHNLLLDLQSHNWIINPESGSRIHHNIFAPRYDGRIVNLVAGITLYDTAVTGVEIHHNTFHGGPGMVAPAIDIGPGVTLGALYSNLFYDFRTDWYYGNAIIRPGHLEAIGGDPPRPGTDPDRLGYANYNAFYSPAAAAGTAAYGVGVEGGVAYGSAAFGSGDRHLGADPLAAAPPTAFPFSDEQIRGGAVTVQQVLDAYWQAYRPAAAGPLVAAADPHDRDTDGDDIGAVQL